jgi:NAD(P)-dependent dehydrogenase (short-subunit alcohol dehydrogenase family)
MKVIVLGGTGTIGSAVVKELSPRHEIVIVGRTSGDILCDITSVESIQEMYEKVGSFDALVIAAGRLVFDDFIKLTYEEYMVGIKSKLMGQVNLVTHGLKMINDHGSFTLTSGILSKDPIQKGVSATMVNSAIDGFVTGASIELPRGIRINCVSPTILEESLQKFADFFRGFKAVSSNDVALAYSKSLEGKQTGKIYSVGSCP